MSAVNDDGSWEVPEPDKAELVQMRIRLITLENIVLGLLSGAAVSRSNRSESART